MIKTDGQRLPAAILLVGPTGSGKTPLGDYLEKHGLAGRRCVHFDFGAQLRRTAHGGVEANFLAPQDVEIAVRSLRSGVLLENEHFRIAEAILDGFMKEKASDADTVLVLNGLPRHMGQAQDMDRVVEVGTVVCLDCAPAVATERIRRNAGGDREGRVDDAPAEIARKLTLYERRTRPLVDHFGRRGADIVHVTVDVMTTAEDIARQMCSLPT